MLHLKNLRTTETCQTLTYQWKILEEACINESRVHKTHSASQRRTIALYSNLGPPRFTTFRGNKISQRRDDKTQDVELNHVDISEGPGVNIQRQYARQQNISKNAEAKT